MRLAIICALCATVLSGEGPRGIAGTWNGSFNGQPVQLKPDGTYPETVTRFRLALTFREGKLRGVLTLLSDPKFKTPIRNAECDSVGCSFEVLDNGDGEVSTWSVR